MDVGVRSRPAQTGRCGECTSTRRSRRNRRRTPRFPQASDDRLIVHRCPPAGRGGLTDAGTVDGMNQRPRRAHTLSAGWCPGACHLLRSWRSWLSSLPRADGGASVSCTCPGMVLAARRSPGRRARVRAAGRALAGRPSRSRPQRLAGCPGPGGRRRPGDLRRLGGRRPGGRRDAPRRATHHLPAGAGRRRPRRHRVARCAPRPGVRRRRATACRSPACTGDCVAGAAISTRSRLVGGADTRVRLLPVWSDPGVPLQVRLACAARRAGSSSGRSCLPGDASRPRDRARAWPGPRPPSRPRRRTPRGARRRAGRRGR